MSGSLLWTGGVLHLKGEIDLDIADALQGAIEAVHALQQSDLTIDASECTFLDSSALACLVRALRYDIDVTIRSPTRAVLRALEVSGVDQLVTIIDPLSD